MSKAVIDKRLEYEAKLRGDSDKIINIMKLINFAAGAVARNLYMRLVWATSIFLCLISFVGKERIDQISADMKFVYYE